ncbi:hypothetical protein KO516_02795 [Citreicella sp. C3M06]|nr:hypothetical protein [Citreicella sp. C3M06]MBU2959770.1 hypothetical protein [Citreicella sp. C3M06]
MQVMIEVPLVFAGDVVQIASGRKGQVLGFENLAGMCSAQFDHYETMR